MTSARTGSSPVTTDVCGRRGHTRRRRAATVRVRRLAALAVSLGLATGCASLSRTSEDAWRGVNARVTHPVRYRAAGEDPLLRFHLDQGEEALAAGNHRAALLAFNRALWDVEHIRKRDLRLTELASVHNGMARAYAGVGNDELAEDARAVQEALGEAKSHPPIAGAVQKFARAKDAYVGAQFRVARKGLRQALLDLEDIADIDTRLAYVAEARCYLAYAYFATGERGRVREELRRLWALDPSLGACGKEAPPGVRAVIGELQRAQKDL